MKNLMKALVVVPALAMTFFYAPILLAGDNALWGIPLFGMLCYGLGHGIYTLLRMIDRKFQ